MLQLFGWRQGQMTFSPDDRPVPPNVTRGVDAEAIEAEFEGQGYGAFKGAVAEAVADHLRPVRERYAELRPDEKVLEEALAGGAERARAIASGTLADVRRVMGIGPPGGG